MSPRLSRWPVVRQYIHCLRHRMTQTQPPPPPGLVQAALRHRLPQAMRRRTPSPHASQSKSNHYQQKDVSSSGATSKMGVPPCFRRSGLDAGCSSVGKLRFVTLSYAAIASITPLTLPSPTQQMRSSPAPTRSPNRSTSSVFP